mmetsp:Transcript_24619/g.56827  ORF Transcript_24619/g.56827 Transcript_24619/m.56827 type:complete len:202 (-) Transcript_24619:400-1005(-)
MESRSKMPLSCNNRSRSCTVLKDASNLLFNSCMSVRFVPHTSLISSMAFCCIVVAITVAQSATQFDTSWRTEPSCCFIVESICFTFSSKTAEMPCKLSPATDAARLCRRLSNLRTVWFVAAVMSCASFVSIFSCWKTTVLRASTISRLTSCTFPLHSRRTAATSFWSTDMSFRRLCESSAMVESGSRASTTATASPIAALR